MPIYSHRDVPVRERKRNSGVGDSRLIPIRLHLGRGVGNRIRMKRTMRDTSWKGVRGGTVWNTTFSIGTQKSQGDFTAPGVFEELARLVWQSGPLGAPASGGDGRPALPNAPALESGCEAVTPQVVGEARFGSQLNIHINVAMDRRNPIRERDLTFPIARRCVVGGGGEVPVRGEAPGVPRTTGQELGGAPETAQRTLRGPPDCLSLRGFDQLSGEGSRCHQGGRNGGAEGGPSQGRGASVRLDRGDA
jgi:hypothetical protein